MATNILTLCDPQASEAEMDEEDGAPPEGGSGNNNTVAAPAEEAAAPKTNFWDFIKP